MRHTLRPGEPAPAQVRPGVLRGSIKVEPLTCTLGAEIAGVSLADAARDDDLFTEIKGLLLRYKVLFLRDQDISRAEHVAFARRFGRLEDHPVAGSDPDHPGLVRIYKDLDSPAEHYENALHTDGTWRENPSMGAVLRCVESPPVGGDTIWVDMAEAYNRLPEHIRTQIEDLRARHSIEATFGAVLPEEKRRALKAQFPDAEHPVVRTHPETGEDGLFVNFGFTERIKGLRRKESDAILGMLFEHVTKPEFQVRFRWSDNAIAFWDNRITQHYAVNDYLPNRRVMNRATILGDRPYHRSRKPAAALAAE